MIQVFTSTAPNAEPRILLGRQLENDAVGIVFDLSWLISTFGDGEAVLVHQRAQDEAPYIVNATQDGATLTWMVSNTDNAFTGVGKAELRWSVGGVLAKTIVYKTWVVKSITADMIMPDVYQSWYDNMIEYIDQLKVDSDAKLVEAVEKAQTSATSAAESEANAEASAEASAQSTADAAESATKAAESEGNAAGYADAAEDSADRAEQAAGQSGYMFFTIEDDGHLYLDKTPNVEVDFEIGADGHLYVEATA